MLFRSDPGIQKNNYSSTPSYSLNHHNFSQYPSTYTTYLPKGWIDLELSWSMVCMSCEKLVNSPFYLDASTCNIDNGDQYSSNSFISHFKRYRYVKVGRTNTTDVVDLCKVEQMFITSWPGNDDPINISCADVPNELAYGFELSWLRDTCKSYCGRRTDGCYLDDGNRVQCRFKAGKEC